MIQSSQLVEIGHTIKPHGINGEIAAAIDVDVDIDALRCIVLDIDGINVPFFIGSWRQRGSQAALFKIDRIDNEEQAQAICGKTIYAFSEDIGESEDEEDGFYADDLSGFTILDDENKPIGVINAVDTSTINTLFVVNSAADGNELFIPVAEEYITAIDPDNKTISMSLPEGLLDI